jgi:hypothetical protein
MESRERSVINWAKAFVRAEKRLQGVAPDDASAAEALKRLSHAQKMLDFAVRDLWELEKAQKRREKAHRGPKSNVIDLNSRRVTGK